MTVETTVLLVEAERLPSSLEVQLSKREVFVEHSTAADVALILPVVVPDLIVQPGDSDLGPTFASIESQTKAIPLVVIADHAKMRALRAEKNEFVAALIPKDLPVAAIAHRIATMARRSAEGRPLENTTRAESSGAKPATPVAQKSGSTRLAPRKEETIATQRGSLAPIPLAPVQDVRIVDVDAEARRLAEQEERERKALEQAEAQQRAVEEARAQRKAQAEAEKRTLQAEREKKRAEAEARAREATEKRRAEINLRAEERRKQAEKRQKEREEKAQQRALEREVLRSSRPPPRSTAPNEDAYEDTTQAVNISAFAPQLDKEAQEKSGSRGPKKPAAPEHRDEFDSIRKDEDLSVILPLPVDMRTALSPQSENLKAIRLALLDTDLTRADAVADSLRKLGMKIHPVTPDPEQTRWPMLRRFAPQGLVVDEKSMARGASDWVERFRGDPFLRHVPVILVRFSRLFSEASAGVTLDPLLHLIEHLGREEFALLENLGPGRQVDLWLSQVPPYRLVEMLTREDRNTRLDCRSHSERMVWPLGPGYAGKGKLADLKTNQPKKRLSPEESLLWLLGHEDCQVSVHEHTEPLAHASESQDAEQLLREMTDSLEAPERHESVRPGSPSRAPNAPSLRPPGIYGSISPVSALATEEALGAYLPDQDGSRTPEPASRRMAQESAPSFGNATWEKSRAALASTKAALSGWIASYENKALLLLAPLEGRLPPKVFRFIPWMVPLIALLLVISIAAIYSADPSPSEGHPAHERQSQEQRPAQALPEEAGKQPKPSAPHPDQAAPNPDPGTSPASQDGSVDDTLGLWKVAPDTREKSCEERLGPAAPKSKDRVKSSGYWKNARRLLMVGNSDAAIENMCLAGLFDPAGPASEGLAEYYLAQRSIAEAERWINESLSADPNRRKSQELKSDIENQKGNIAESKKILLATMKLRNDETKKMELTARKLKQDASLARKGGDLPRAERELRRAALLSPNDTAIAIDLAEVLLRRNVPEAAARWAKQALTIDPNHSVAMLLSGRIAEVQGKKDSARHFYEMVPLGDPLHHEAQTRRGRL